MDWKFIMKRNEWEMWKNSNKYVVMKHYEDEIHFFSTMKDTLDFWRNSVIFP